MIEWILLVSLIGMIILGIQLKDYTYPRQIQKKLIKEFNKEWEQMKMTERFTYVRGDGFTDNGKHINPYEVTDLLNKLSTENRQLKQELNCENSLFTKKQLHEENQQLKKQIESEHQMLDNAILLERTRMGKNSLIQYREAIQ